MRMCPFTTMMSTLCNDQIFIYTDFPNVLSRLLYMCCMWKTTVMKVIVGGYRKHTLTLSDASEAQDFENIVLNSIQY